MDYAHKGGKEALPYQLSLEGKTMIWASISLTILVLTNIYTSIVFKKDLSMIIIPVAENIWMIIAYLLLIYGCIKQRFKPLSFLLVVSLVSVLIRFVGILMCTMMAAFPDSYTRKLNRLGDNVREGEVRIMALVIIVLSLLLEVLEIVTTVYTLICRYHLKEIGARRRRREAALRRRQRHSVDRASQNLDEQLGLKSFEESLLPPQQLNNSITLQLQAPPSQVKLM